MYHLFVNLLLVEVKDGLGGAWAFVLRDIIYTLVHHLNSRSGGTQSIDRIAHNVVFPGKVQPVSFFPHILRRAQCDEVSTRSLSLCCDLLTSVCRAALEFCDGALDGHLQVIVGTLTAQAKSRPAVSGQVSGRESMHESFPLLQVRRLDKRPHAAMIHGVM